MARRKSWLPHGHDLLCDRGRSLMKHPTVIYLLVDTRPETIAKGWSNGFPFYCGRARYRYVSHILVVGSTTTPRPTNRKSDRLPDRWIRDCGQHIRMQVMRVVPAGGDWETAHRDYIRWMRTNFPGGANITDGWTGPLGYRWTDEQLEQRRVRRFRTKRQLSVERKRKVAERLKNAHNR